MSTTRYVLTRTLPDGEAKASTTGHKYKVGAAKQAARSHRDNTAGAFGWQRVADALMSADPGETVGPFDGYSYRIDVWRVEP